MMIKMIRKILVVVLTLVLLTGCVKPSNVRNGLYLLDNVDSVWVWDATKVDKYRTVPDLKFLNIKTAYVNTGWTDKVQNYYIEEKPLMYASFIESANSYGIDIQALLGNNEWAKEENYNDMKKEVDSIFKFNNKYKYTFSAIHLDIGFYKFNDWDNNYKTYLSSYLNNLDRLQKEIKEHNKTNKDTIKLVVDVPYWLTEDKYESFADDLFDIVDEVVVLNFNTEKDLLKNNIKFLEKADKNNKSIKIGVSLESGSILEGKNPDELIEFFKDNLKELDKYKSFKGLSVSEYKSLENYNEKHFKK